MLQKLFTDGFYLIMSKLGEFLEHFCYIILSFGRHELCIHSQINQNALNLTVHAIPNCLLFLILYWLGYISKLLSIYAQAIYSNCEIFRAWP